MGMTNQEIEFSLPPGDTIGILSPETDTTDRDGQAVTALQTDEEAGDDALVEGWYQWTNQSGDVTVAVSDAVRVRLGTITGNWSITGTETWSLCTDPADNGTFSGSGEVRFAQLDDTVTGHGWISPEDDLISEDDFIVGTIQRIGERGFEVTGTSTYREEYLVCEDGGCENWIVNGFTEFRGTGSIDSDTIRFTWHGRDLSGDTCVSEGEGQTTYVGR
jgi:hypothetical protein